jgi:hypothetical protein
MKNFLISFWEKLKIIYHLFTNNEYATFTVTMKDGEKTKSSCYISQNASDIFLSTIVDFTDNYRKNTFFIEEIIGNPPNKKIK